MPWKMNEKFVVAEVKHFDAKTHKHKCTHHDFIFSLKATMKKLTLIKSWHILLSLTAASFAKTHMLEVMGAWKCCDVNDT